MAGAILKSCRCCGNQYSVPARRAPRSNYCSVPCRVEARRVPITERFWQYVEVGGADECWPWRGAKRGEYGCVRADGSNKAAHRVAYEIKVGKIPDGLELRHSCDNPPCCNPVHLLIGTHTDNMQDMRDRGRGYGQVLVASDVAKIRALFFEDHIPQRKIARVLGMSASAVSLAIRGLNWAETGTPTDDAVKEAVAMTRAVRRGSDSNLAKMNPEMVRAMRSEFAAGSSQADIAKKYGMSKMATSLAIRRKTWAHVE